MEVDNGDVKRGLYGALYAAYNAYKRRMNMANPFVHIELHTQDTEKAKKFYGELFEWTLEDYPDMNYTMKFPIWDGLACFSIRPARSLHCGSRKCPYKDLRANR